MCFPAMAGTNVHEINPGFPRKRTEGSNLIVEIEGRDLFYANGWGHRYGASGFGIGFKGHEFKYVCNSYNTTGYYNVLQAKNFAVKNGLLNTLTTLDSDTLNYGLQTRDLDTAVYYNIDGMFITYPNSSDYYDPEYKMYTTWIDTKVADRIYLEYQLKDNNGNYTAKLTIVNPNPKVAIWDSAQVYKLYEYGSDSKHARNYKEFMYIGIPDVQLTCNHPQLSGWRYDDTYHYRVCERCGAYVDRDVHHPVDKVTQQPTCTAGGWIYPVCTVCNQVCGPGTSLPALQHVWETTWSSDDNTHWHKCSRCGAAKDVANHAWKNVKEVDDCNSGHYIDWECSVCKKKKRETLRAPGHDYQMQWHEENGVKDAYQQMTCTRCGAVTGDKIYPKVTVYYKLIDDQGKTVFDSYSYGYSTLCEKGKMVSASALRDYINTANSVDDGRGNVVTKYNDNFIDINGKLYKWVDYQTEVAAGSSDPTYAVGKVELQWFNVDYVTVDQDTGTRLDTFSQKVSSGTLVKGSDLGTKDITYNGVKYRYISDTRDTVYDQNVVVFRYVVKDEYPINFDPNGGTGAMASIKATYGKPVQLPKNEFTRTGYTFDYWSRNEYGTDGQYTDQSMVTDIVKDGEASVTLYAIWTPNKYTVSFDNLYNSKKDPIKVVFDSQYGPALSENLPTRAGYTFVHWELDGATIGSSTVVTTPNDHTLTAVWKERLCQVTFKDDPKSQMIEVPYTGKVQPPYTPSKKGYTFKYWSLQPDGAEFDFNTSIVEDIDLYAVYEGNTIDIILPGYGTIQRVYPEPYGNLPEPQRPGFSMDGWFYDTELKNPVGRFDTVPDKGPVTLYPKYTEVTYIINFDTGDPHIEIKYGEYIPTLPTPKRENKIFKGWYYKDERVTAGKPFKYNGNINLISKWEDIICTVTFSTGESFTVSRGSRLTTIPQVPPKDGMVAVGWVDQNGRTVDSSTQILTNLQCSPKYQNKPITITLIDDGKVDTMQVESGKPLLNLPKPEKAGFKFRWWSTSTSGSAYSGIPYGDLTLYAVYAAGLNQVTFDCLPDILERATGEEFGNLPEPIRDGYNFDCWVHADGKKVKSTDTVPHGGEKLYARWIPKNPDPTDTVEIRFWSDGIRINTLDLLRGEILYDQEDPALTEVDDRKFKWWSLSPNGSQYEFGHYVNTDLDLYAVWYN